MLGTILQSLKRLLPKPTRRLSLEIDERQYRYFSAMARKEGITFEALLERGIFAMKHFQHQRRIGRTHMGFVADRTKLDAELLLFSGK